MPSSESGRAVATGPAAGQQTPRARALGREGRGERLGGRRLQERLGAAQEYHDDVHGLARPQQDHPQDTEG